MTEDELRTIIQTHESDRLELTESASKKDRFTEKSSEAVCAFSNDLPNHQKPGYLVVGLTDNFSHSGIVIDDALLLQLSELRANGNIQPLPEIIVEKVTWGDRQVAVVTVQPSSLPPVRYKGRVCIRVGPRRAYATQYEEQRLSERRVSHARTFDAQPCRESSIESLSTALFLLDYRQHVIAPEIIEENHRTIEHQLASLRFFDIASNVPTNAGVILFGTDVCNFLPGAYIQFLRISGTTLADNVENDRQITGDLFTILRELDALVDAQFTQTLVSSSLLKEEVIEVYPKVAVRELIMNGIMHRDYAATGPLRIYWFDDRIEIQNPGGLYGEASEENFPKQNSYRNPIIAEALKALGYVNRYGRGIIRAQEFLKKNGNPAAEFTFDSGYVLATIWRYKI